MAGIRQAFKKGKGADTTAPERGSQRPSKKPEVPKIPKDKGRPKRKKKVTFNSPKTTKISYG